jgi:uncharacterized membrane protein
MADPTDPVADLPRDPSAPPGVTSTNLKLAVATAVGVVATVVMGLTAGWQFSGLVGWDVAAVIIVSWTLWEIWPMDAERTARTAVREEPARALTDLLLVGASVASLVGVGFVIVAGGNSHGAGKGFLVALAVATVAVSWAVVHTSYTVRYARLFYAGEDGGLDFHSPNREVPQFSDFAYAAFTIGMTFQVSDTEATTKEMRATILKHALLSYLFGVVIIAIMINLVASLTK